MSQDHASPRHGQTPAAGNPLFSTGMIAVLSAQFISALADNALLFAAIALLQSQMAADWHIPLLQEFFVLAFILLAPFVGPFADSLPKGRVMLLANSLKLMGALAMLSGLQPLLAYGMVGMGAAAYSPAKYGILSELVDAERLVKANSMMEGSTIVAILLGAIIGGLLADYSVSGALLTIVICYVLAIIANLFIPCLAPAHPLHHFNLRAMLGDFARASRTLCRDTDARFALLGTSIFWGAGALCAFCWWPGYRRPADQRSEHGRQPERHGGYWYRPGCPGGGQIRYLADRQPHAAGRSFDRCSDHGFCLYQPPVYSYYHADTGRPVRRLLRRAAERHAARQGSHTVGAGHAIAVQNFMENLCMLLLIGAYTLMDKSGVHIITSTVMIGFIVLFGIGLLAYGRYKQKTAAC